jgi:hypothetical protein
MQQRLGIAVSDLPVLWDTDFLYGAKDASGDDTYVLCEINVSCVSPFPDEALSPLVDAIADSLSIVSYQGNPWAKRHLSAGWSFVADRDGK